MRKKKDREKNKGVVCTYHGDAVSLASDAELVQSSRYIIQDPRQVPRLILTVDPVWS